MNIVEIWVLERVARCKIFTERKILGVFLSLDESKRAATIDRKKYSAEKESITQWESTPFMSGVIGSKGEMKVVLERKA